MQNEDELFPDDDYDKEQELFNDQDFLNEVFDDEEEEGNREEDDGLNFEH